MTMSADSYSASLASRLTVPCTYSKTQAYYRSKLFTASSITNPLIAAAGPLFSLLERLCISPTLPPINHLRDNIQHELHAFHSRLLSQHYSEDLIAISGYLLSATIDELIGKNYLRINRHAAEFQSFTPLTNDEVGPERRFFDIVNYIKERTNQYLDIIELAYFSLIAGFEGEHHLRTDGRQTLDNLIEELFQLIQQHRANKPIRLFKEPTCVSEPPPINIKPFITTSLLLLGLITSVFFISHTLLEHKAKTVLLGHTVLANLDH